MEKYFDKLNEVSPTGGDLEGAKEYLNNFNVPFESQPDHLPGHVLESIKKGLTDFENNQTISLKDFKEKHFSKNEL